MCDSIDCVTLTACGRDHVLAVMAGPALPRHVLRRVDPRLLEQRLVEMAVGAFERAHEGALLGPALPLVVLLLLGVFVGLVVADARPYLFVHPCHSGASFISSPRSAGKQAALHACCGKRVGASCRSFKGFPSCAQCHGCVATRRGVPEGRLQISPV